MCILLRFSLELVSDTEEKVFFLDLLFHASSFWSVWVWVGPCIVWFLLVGLCFGLGLLQVRWSLKSTTSLKSALYWGGTFEISLSTTPRLTFPHQISLFFLFWWYHRPRKYYRINSTNIQVGNKSVMITGINYLRIFPVMITDWETYFTDLQANDFGNLGKNNSGNIVVGNHAVIFTESSSPRFFFFVMFVWRMVVSLKTLTSLNKEVRPFFLSDNSIWSLPSVSSLSDYSIWSSWRLF